MPHRVSEKGAVWVDKNWGKLHEKGEISAGAWRDHQNLIDGERSRLRWEPGEKKNRVGKERQESRNRNQEKKKQHLSCLLHLLQLWEVFLFVSFFNIYLATLVLDVACGILFPDQGLNSWPPACDLRVLVIGPPGQPPGVYVNDGGLES